VISRRAGLSASAGLSCLFTHQAPDSDLARCLKVCVWGEDRESPQPYPESGYADYRGISLLRKSAENRPIWLAEIIAQAESVLE